MHRADGGRNEAANLTTLCRFHHRLVHEGGWAIERCDDTDGLVAITPNGTRMAAARSTGDDTDADRIVAINDESGLAIDSETVVPMWSGDRLDLGWAVTSLWYSNHPEARAELADGAAAVLQRAA